MHTSSVLLGYNLTHQVCQVRRSDVAPIEAMSNHSPPEDMWHCMSRDTHLDIGDYETKISCMFHTQCGNWQICYKACTWNTTTLSVLPHILWKINVHSLSLQADLEIYTKKLENGCHKFGFRLLGNFLEIWGFTPRFSWANHDIWSRD